MASDERSRDLNLSDRYANGSFKASLPSTESQLMSGVNAFFKNYHLDNVMDITLLKRGALLAQDPDNMKQPVVFDLDGQDGDSSNRTSLLDTPTNISIAPAAIHAAPSSDLQPRRQLLLSAEHRFLTQRESDALRRENEAKFRSLTKSQFFVLATCALGAILQGSSQESLVGANINWPIELNIVQKQVDVEDAFAFKKHGVGFFSAVNGIPWFAAAIIGSWVSDPLTSYFGRRTTLLLAGIFSLAAPIGGAYCTTWWHLFICRLLQGIGMGAKSSVIPVLESEISPPRMRGRLLVSWQTFVATGIALGAATNLIFHYSWRLQLGINFVPAIPFIFGCLFLTESPYWLIKREKCVRAYRALRDLRPTELQAARDLYLLYYQVKVENLFFSKSHVTERHLEAMFEAPKSPEYQIRKSTLFQKFPQLFKIDRNRRAVLASCTVMAAQQFSGLNIFAFLATTVFLASNFDAIASLWFGLGFGCVNAICSALVYFFIDRLGRRNLLMSSQILMTPFIFLTGYFLNRETGKSTDSGQAVISAFVIIYVAIYSWGAGVIPFMYSSEVFPAMYREAGMSLACMVNFALAGTLLVVIPFYTYQHCDIGGLDVTLFNGTCSEPGTTPSKMSQVPREFSSLGKMLYVFGGLNISATALVWLVLRTPDEPTSLQDMNFLFGAPSKDYIRYQIFEILPWIVKLPFRSLRRSMDEMPDRFEYWRQGRLQGNTDAEGQEMEDF